MKYIQSFLRFAGLILLAGLLPGQTLRAAVAFTITPSTVSNTYNGTITLQVTGLTNTETVLIQKFVDANSNGIVDAGEVMVQQFKLTDGQATVFSGVTNLNIPGDLNVATGAITAVLRFNNGDVSQNLVGKYGYRLSSPVGHFAAITNYLVVSNYAFGQAITGTVSNHGTNVPNAVVLLFVQTGKDMNPQAGTVANGSGSYFIRAAPGTYLMAAFKSNYVADLSISPTVTLNAGTTNTANLILTNASETISGQLVDTNSSTTGLPGVFLPTQSTNNLLAINFTGTNGNFTAGVRAGVWKMSGGSQGLEVQGYISTQNKVYVDASAGSVSGVIFALFKVTDMFYGSVQDNLGNPLAGLNLYAQDNNNQNETDTITDAGGNFFLGALAGQWQLGISDKNPGFTNYVFSQGPNNQNGGTNLTSGQALLWNFTGIPATHHITGNVKDSNGSNIGIVQIFASATINGTNYQVFGVDTDASGNYSLTVANGNWSVGVSCQGGSDSLDSVYGSSTYQCPANASVNITNNDGTANIVVQLCSGVQITTTNLAGGQVGNYYSTNLNASSCNSNFTWSVSSGSLPPGLTLYSDGLLNGTPTNNGTFNFTVQVIDGNSKSTNQALSLTITNALLQITTVSLPGGTNGSFYSQPLNATGGQLPYNWSLKPASSLPPNLMISNLGSISGTLATNGTFNFSVRLTDGASTIVDQPLTLNVAPNASTNPSPSVNIVSIGNQVVVFYPLSASNYTLQTTTNVGGGWVTATNGVPVNAVLFTNAGPPSFFRLHQ